MTEETLEMKNEILEAIVALSNKIDDYKKESDAQFESIRQGLFDNNVRLDRLEGNFYLLRAEVSALTEEIRHNRKVLV